MSAYDMCFTIVVFLVVMACDLVGGYQHSFNTFVTTTVYDNHCCTYSSVGFFSGLCLGLQYTKYALSN